MPAAISPALAGTSAATAWRSSRTSCRTPRQRRRADPAATRTPWVKIVGDWIDRELGDLAPCWPADVLAEAVARAHDAGARVGVHVFGEEALPDLIAAGVDSIEHGTGLDESMLDAVARRPVSRSCRRWSMVAKFDKFADQATKYPAYADRMRRLKRSARRPDDGRA